MTTVNKTSHSTKIEEEIKNARNGKQRSMTFLYDAYKGYVEVFLKRSLKNEPIVEELVQDTFIKAFRSLDQFQDGTSFTSWLSRIARNTLIDYIRSQESEKNQFQSDIGDEYQDHHVAVKAADHDIINKETMLTLKKAIHELPWKDKRVYSMRFIENKSYEEIADYLNVALGTVKSHIHRIRKNLKNKLLTN